MNINNYWDKKIIEWEDSIFKKEASSFIEKIAAYFREPLRVRTQTCLNLAAPFVDGKTVLELGCGSGFFAFELSERKHLKRFIGLDVSRNAVTRANKISKGKKIDPSFSFIEADVCSLDALPEADITIGLGFLDYLTKKEIESIFEKVKSKYFIFTFSEKKLSILRLVHIVYLLSQQCPKHFYYTKREIRNCLPETKNIKFVNDKKLSFCCIFHNLPDCR